MTILGRTFDPMSPITANFPPGSAFSLFRLVSELKVAPDKAEGTETHELVKGDPSMFTVPELSQKSARSPNHASTLAIAASGKGEGDKKYELVVFGDSDFLTNHWFFAGVNRDLAMNAVAQLANQKDLISIKPKQAKGTTLTLTPTATWTIVILVLMIPLALLLTSLVIWFRRRGA